MFEKLAKAVHSGKMSEGMIDNAVVSFVSKSLLKGVFTGFGDDFSSVDYTTPDRKMLNDMEKNIYFFSCAKQYHEVVELNEALKDGDKVLTFNEFKNKAFEINEKFNVTHLNAEWQHAIGSSQMARRWLDIQEAKETHPYLRYDTIGDDRVRQSHRELEGVTKPIDDSFWDAWFPPNDWNCRCDVEQLTSGKETDNSKIVTPTDVPDMFKVNTAKLGVVYPPKHPIWALPKTTKEELQKESQKILRREHQKEAKENLVTKDASVKRKELDKPITFNVSGVKELINQPHKHYYEKNSLVRNLDTILKTAKYLGSHDFKAKLPFIQNHIFEIEINSERSFIIVKEKETGEMICHSISDSDKVLEGIKKPKRKKPK